jgi:hypothetical protein
LWNSASSLPDSVSYKHNKASADQQLHNTRKWGVSKLSLADKGPVVVDRDSLADKIVIELMLCNAHPRESRIGEMSRVNQD